MKRRALEVEPGEAGTPLGRFLARRLELSDEHAARLVAEGAAYVNGRRAHDAQLKLAAGQKVLAVLEERGQSVLDEPQPPPAAVELLFENAALVAVAKPAGIPTQGTEMRQRGSLLDVVRTQLRREVWLVHRLDRETSGVVLFALTRAAAARLNAQFRAGTVQKRYLAITPPNLPERGEIDLPISRDPGRPGRMRASRKAHGAAALTRYERLFATEAFAGAALTPLTGRTHQLRAHLRALDAPIAGDVLYGGARTLGGIDAPRCLLHAHALRLDGAPELLAPVPADLRRFFEAAAAPLP